MSQGLHHISIRKRIYKSLETYPHEEKGKRLFDELMYVIGILGPLVMLPQVMQIWIYKNAEGISVITWSSLSVFSLLWLAYGIIHKEKPIVFSNALLFIFNLLIVLGALINH